MKGRRRFGGRGFGSWRREEFQEEEGELLAAAPCGYRHLAICAVRAAGASTRATLLAPPPESGEFLGATVWSRAHRAPSRTAPSRAHRRLGVLRDRPASWDLSNCALKAA